MRPFLRVEFTLRDQMLILNRDLDSRYILCSMSLRPTLVNMELFRPQQDRWRSSRALIWMKQALLFNGANPGAPKSVNPNIEVSD